LYRTDIPGDVLAGDGPPPELGYTFGTFLKGGGAGRSLIE
jgi:hypothetical protein